MFEGRSFVQCGYNGWSIRFADKSKSNGAATTSYSFALSERERFELARRITAALNLTAHLPTEAIEAAIPLLQNKYREKG